MTSNLQTIIFYAGVMNYLIPRERRKKSDEIHDTEQDFLMSQYGKIYGSLTDEMREILFELLKIYGMMESKGLLGVIPVMTPYKRLHPLFYYLSQTERLFYTVEDHLLTMRPIKQVEDPLATESALINELQKEIERIERTKEPSTNLENLKRMKRIHEAEHEAILYTNGCSNKIEYRGLKNLAPEERKRLQESEAGKYIMGVFGRYNEISIDRCGTDDLMNGNTFISLEPAPIYNFGMSMIETFQSVENRSIPCPGKQDIRPFKSLLKKYEGWVANHISDRGKNKADVPKALEELEGLTMEFSKQVEAHMPATTRRPRIWMPVMPTQE